MGLICRIVGHRRAAKRTWYDKLNWRSNCRLCGAELLKEGLSGKWRAFDGQADFDAARRVKDVESRANPSH